MSKRVQLFGVLRRELGRPLTVLGFQEVPPNPARQTWMLEFARDPARAAPLRLWFQRDVKAFDVDIRGSRFTLEFGRSMSLRDRERFFPLLTPEEREEVRRIQNGGIQRLPPPRSPFLRWLAGLLARVGIVEEWRQPVTEPYPPDEDVWMRYRDEQDVQAWAGFAARLLPSLIQRFDVAKPA